MAVNVGSAVGYLDLDSKGFLQGLKEAESQTKLTGANLETAMGKSLQSAGKKMQSAGKSMTAWVTTPIVGAGAAVIKTTADFDEGMSKVQALSGATTDDLERLRAKAKEMGATTKFSATESSEAFQYMALAGWDADEMIDGIAGTMALAAASGEDLASVSDIVTDGLTAFGLEAKDAAHFSDVLATAMSSSNTDVAGLGEAFKYVGPVAGAFGYTVEDVSIALGSMANAGIKGSSMGTSLRQALVQLTSPSETAAMYMDKFNVSLFNADGSTKDLMTVMQDLRGTFGSTLADIDMSEDAMNELSAAVEADENAWYDYADSLNLPQDEQEKLTALTEIFGARAMPAMLAVIQSGDDDFNDLADSIYHATQFVNEATGETLSYAEAQEKFGQNLENLPDSFKRVSSAEEMQKTMMNNLNGQITIIKSSLEGFAISLGELLMPKIREFAEKIQGLLDYFNSLDDAQKMQIVKFAAIAAAIGPALLAFGKITSGVGTFLTVLGKIPGAGTKVSSGLLTVETALGKFRNGFRMAQAGMAATGAQSSVLGAALGSITAPIAAVIAIIAALVAAFAYLWQTNEDFRNNILGIWEHIKSSFENFCQGIVDRLNSLGFEFESITDVLMAIWDGFCQFLAPVFETVFNEIAVILDSVFSVLTGILDIFIGIFTGDWDTFLQGIQEVFGGIWDLITGTLDNVLNNGILGILQTFTGDAELTWEDVWNAIADFFSNIWEGIVSFFSNIGQTLLQAVSGFLQNVYNFFSELPGKIWDFLTSAFEHVIQWAGDMLNKAVETGTNFLNNVVNFFIQLPGKIQGFISSAFENVKTWATNMWNKASEMGRTFISNVGNTLLSLPGKVAQWLSSALSKAASWVTDMGNKGKEAISNLIDSAKNAASNIGDKVKSIGDNLIKGVWNGISAGTQWIKDKISGWVGNVTDFLKNLFGIKSPSRLMANEIGVFLPPGIAQGFEKTLPDALDDMGDALDEGIEDLSDVDLTGNAVMNASEAVQGMKYAYGELTDWFDSIEVRMAAITAKMLNDMALLIGAGQLVAAGNFGYVGYNGFGTAPASANVETWDSGNNGNGNGDTFIFNSPNPIDEIEAARQVRKTKQDMAEGF